jgi:glycosyltransferase involved in cell wall biosynthesis
MAEELVKSGFKRIGIDAKWFFSGPVSNRIVIQNLVENLIKENPGHRLVIFLNRKHRYASFPFSEEKVERVYVWGGNNMISNLLLLPLLGKKHHLDGILYQNFGSFFGPRPWVYIHDLIFKSHPQFFTWKERLYFSFMPFLLRFADKVITISNSEKSRILAHCPFLKAPVYVVQHGRNAAFQTQETFSEVELERVKESYQLPHQFILFVGRLNDRKNIGNLLQALDLLDNPAQLVIVGEEDWQLDPGLRERLKEGQKSGKLILTGKVPFVDLPVLYSLATLFCFPSFAEGFGLPVLEAMSAGIPVATSEKSAMEEVCGEAAMYFDPHSPESISSAIQILLSDSGLRGKLREKGLAQSRMFDWKKSGTKIYEAIQ